MYCSLIPADVYNSFICSNWAFGRAIYNNSLVRYSELDTNGKSDNLFPGEAAEWLDILLPGGNGLASPPF